MSGFLSGSVDATRQRILDGTVEVFRKKGSSFTMNDISKELSMSKKTIYSVFRDKESLLFNLVDYFFNTVKIDEEKINNDESLSTKEKLIKILGAMPEAAVGIDFSSINSLREKYPRVGKRIEERLESGWDSTIALLKKGQDEGIFRSVDTVVFQMTFEAAIERFLSTNELKKAHISYDDALNELVNILVNGVCID